MYNSVTDMRDVMRRGRGLEMMKEELMRVDMK